MPRTSNTRAAQGSGTIRQRKDGRWEARYTVGRDPGTGKQVQRSIYGDTEKEVLKKLTAINAGINDGTYLEPSKLTVGHWLDIWLAEYLGGVKPRTADSYKASCRVHLKPALGAVKLSALSAHMIQTLYNRLQKPADDKQGLSPKSIKNLNGVFHKALQQAVKLGYIRVNPADAVELPRVIKQEIKPLDGVETAAFLDAIQGHRLETLYVATLFTGMRQGEVLGLTWDCVDFERGTILIDRQLQQNRETRKYGFVTTKNSKRRLVTPAPFVIKALREQRRRQSEWRLLAGSMWEDSGLVFTNEFGRHLTPEIIRKPFKKIVDALNLPKTRFHDMRHSYAVAALSSGDDIKSVQEALGHHTAAFTLDVYGHVTERMKQESAARMEAYIQRCKGSIKG
jgi:integrase